MIDDWRDPTWRPDPAQAWTAEDAERLKALRQQRDSVTPQEREERRRLSFREGMEATRIRRARQEDA